MTYAELCAEVAGQLEIDETDYLRFNLAANANKSVRHLARVLPVELIPELVRTQVEDFEITGAVEPEADYVRSVRLNLTYSGSALGPGGAEARWIPPAEWGASRSLSDIPTEDYPVYTHLGDYLSITPTGLNGVIMAMPLPAAKVTQGLYHVYVGFKDAVDSTHAVPLGERFRPLVVNLTCKNVCLVNHFDPVRAEAYSAMVDAELAGLIPKGE